MNDIWVIARMLLVFLIIIPWITGFIFKKTTELNDWERIIICIFTTMLIFAGCMITDTVNQIHKPYTTRNVVAMQDSEVYIVSRYSVDSEMKYYYVTERNGVYRTLSASSDSSIIRYADDNPRVEVFKAESKYKIFKWFLPAEYVNDLYRYEFYLPKNSIKNEISIDLK